MPVIEIRFHGRGGQGVVTASEILAAAAFKKGYFAQAFPSFGVERSGAPIQSFVRLSQEAIITREQIHQPDYIIVLDESLISRPETWEGFSKNTKLLINTERSKEDIKKEILVNIKINNIFISPATSIAWEILGRNMVNTIILGSFLKNTKLFPLKSLLESVAEKFKDKGEKIVKQNQEAIKTIYEYK